MNVPNYCVAIGTSSCALECLTCLTNNDNTKCAKLRYGNAITEIRHDCHASCADCTTAASASNCANCYIGTVAGAVYNFAAGDLSILKNGYATCSLSNNICYYKCQSCLNTFYSYSCFSCKPGFALIAGIKLYGQCQVLDIDTCHFNCLTCSVNNDETKCFSCNFGKNFAAGMTPPNYCVNAGSSACHSSCFTC